MRLLLPTLILLASCQSPYSFTPIPPQSTSNLTPQTLTPVPSDMHGTAFMHPRAHNSYVCACRALVPRTCIHFECGLVGSGTTPTSDGFCDLGPRELNICFNGIPTTQEEVEADCSGRVRGAVLLGLRWSFRVCTNVNGNCGIRLVCTSITDENIVRTEQNPRCESCEQTALEPDLSNSRTATYVPESMQLLCSWREDRLTPEQQRVCGSVNF